MRNPEGGAAPCAPQLMYKVPFPLQVFFRKRGRKRRGMWPWTWQFGGCGCIATDSSRVPKKQKKKGKKKERSKAIWLVKHSVPARTALKAACVSIEPDLEMQLHKAHMADAVHKPTVHLDVFFLQNGTLLTFSFSSAEYQTWSQHILYLYTKWLHL